MASDNSSPMKDEAGSSTGNSNYSQVIRSNALMTSSFAELDDDDDDETSMAIEGTTPSGDRRRLFSKEIRLLLFGYGDDPNPYTETVDTLEDLVLEFITDMTQRSLEIGRSGRVQVEDIIFLIRKHPRMYARVKDLLMMNEELKKARKAFDEIKYVQGSS